MGLIFWFLSDRDKAPQAESAFRRQDQDFRTPEPDSEERPSSQVGVPVANETARIKRTWEYRVNEGGTAGKIARPSPEFRGKDGQFFI